METFVSEATGYDIFLMAIYWVRARGGVDGSTVKTHLSVCSRWEQQWFSIKFDTGDGDKSWRMNPCQGLILRQRHSSSG
jgi:hypothetical protein